MKPFVWTAVAIVGALLVETGLSYLVTEPGRYLDPFLLVVVYCALTRGEAHGMLAGMAAGWVQDVHFGGQVAGLSALSKLLVGFAVGAASSHLIAGAPARHRRGCGPRAVAGLGVRDRRVPDEPRDSRRPGLSHRGRGGAALRLDRSSTPADTALRDDR
jgi:hypothetical protein